jgi:hypothetical protein
MRNGRCYEHPTLVLLTVEPESSLLPTPTASNPNDGEDLESWEERRQRNLAKGTNGNGQGTPLSVAVRLLPTSCAADGNGGRQHRAGSFTATGMKENGTKIQVSLRDALNLLESGGLTNQPSPAGNESSESQHPTLWTSEDD